MTSGSARERMYRAADHEFAPLTSGEHAASIACWCRPYQDTVEPDLWIHRAAARA